MKKSNVFATNIKNELIDLGNREYLYNNLITLLHYGDKKSKSVVLPCTLHNQPCNNIEKSEIVHYYNQNKAVVDMATNA